MLVDEAIETGAARSAIEPQQQRIGGGIAFRLHQVVEELPPMRLVHRHIPLNTKTKRSKKHNIITLLHFKSSNPH
jgi:hypothetical protein